MRTITLLAAVAAIVAIPSSTAAVQPAGDDLAAWNQALAPCRATVVAVVNGNKAEARRLTDAMTSEAEIVLCTAYAMGALDMSEGRIVPLDVN